MGWGFGQGFPKSGAVVIANGDAGVAADAGFSAPLADNLNPGMGVRFLDLTIDARERLVDVIHTIAYVRDEAS